MTEPNPAKDVVADVEADMRQRAAEAARLWPEWAGELVPDRRPMRLAY